MIEDECLSSVNALILTASGCMTSQDLYYNMLQTLWRGFYQMLPSFLEPQFLTLQLGSSYTWAASLSFSLSL